MNVRVISRFLPICVAMTLVAFQAAVAAETIKLERKVLPDRSPSYESQDELPYRLVTPQRFWTQSGNDEGQKETDKQFNAAVKKEPPKYQCYKPFRGVATLGSDKYGFVLDGEDLRSKGYDLLYFDVNRNGDLTDDPAVKARPSRGMRSDHEFPRVDVTINVDGKPLAYAFFVNVYSQFLGAYDYASVSLCSAVYFEGRGKPDGKERRLVVLDFNSNGRFNDQAAVSSDDESGRVYTRYGDMLLVDPDPKAGSSRGYTPIECKDRQYVSKLANLDGHFYDVAILPTGESITLTESKLPVAFVANANERFDAVLYGDLGFVKIGGGKAGPAPVPVGRWKLLNYRIDLTNVATAPAEKPAEAKKPSILARLFSGVENPVSSGPKYTWVTADGTKNCPAVDVREGKTALLPFGPPYKAIVSVSYLSGNRQASLGMQIVGAAGENCTDLMVKGERPGKPEFEIRNKKGELVDSGKFEWG